MPSAVVTGCGVAETEGRAENKERAVVEDVVIEFVGEVEEGGEEEMASAER